MGLLQIKRTELNLGLKREYRFFQISDLHLSFCDSESSLVDVNEHKRSSEGWKKLKLEFANQNDEFCDERYDVEANVLFEALCNYACDFNADALILSGDIMDRVTESNIRYLKRFFEKFPLPIIYCPGNHCSMNEYGEHINQYDRIKDLFPSSPYFQAFDYEEFEIIAVDNNLPITDGQLNLLKEKILSDKKLLLIEHKPLLLGEFGEIMLEKIGSYFFMGTKNDDDNTMEFVNLVKENSHRFIAVLCGHIHSAKEYKITDNLMQISTSSGLIGAGREIIIK